jgi:hypothetical protein
MTKSIKSTHRMPKRNTNESQPYKIIHATKWSKGGRGEKRTRLIVQEYAQKNPFGKWAVRWQSYDGATFGGGALNSKETATNMFMKKYAEHNDSYKKGNISHLPGIVR